MTSFVNATSASHGISLEYLCSKGAGCLAVIGSFPPDRLPHAHADDIKLLAHPDETKSADLAVLKGWRKVSIFTLFFACA